MSAVEELAHEIRNIAFRVSYTVASDLRIEAKPEDLDMYLKEYPEDANLPYHELARGFLAWCIAEDGYDFDEREMPVVTGFVLCA